MRRRALTVLLATSALLTPFATGPASANPAQLAVRITVHLPQFPCPAGQTCTGTMDGTIVELVAAGPVAYDAVLVGAAFEGPITYHDEDCTTGSGGGGMTVSGGAATGIITTGPTVVTDIVFAGPLSIGWERSNQSLVLTASGQYNVRGPGVVVVAHLNATGPAVGSGTPPVLPACAGGSGGPAEMTFVGVLAGA